MVQQLLPGRKRIHVNAPARAIESDVSVYQCEDGVIATEADISARYIFSTALANDDVAGHYGFTSKSFHAQPLADAIAAVLNAALSFFMSHFRECCSLIR
jgi:hypothetical protein